MLITHIKYSNVKTCQDFCDYTAIILINCQISHCRFIVNATPKSKKNVQKWKVTNGY